MKKNVKIQDNTLLGAAVYDFSLSGFELTEGTWTVSVEKVRQTRSISQNRMYWGYILPMIAMETGYETDELHEFFKTKFASEIKDILGVNVDVGSTKNMDTKDFTNYIDQVKAYCLKELGLHIPEESDVSVEELHELANRYESRYG